jgi:hypothetical protein
MKGRMASRVGVAAVALAAGAAVAAWGGTARAAESRADVETDHIDAFDDGGPRSFGLLVNPAALAFGTVAAEGDFVVADLAAASVGGTYTSLGGTTAYGAELGLPIYPWKVVFHGFYLHPRVLWAHAAADGGSVDVLGGGASMGWQWTWRFGLTLKVGAGAAYATPLQGGPSVAVTGLRPVLDGQVGWVF